MTNKIERAGSSTRVANASRDTLREIIESDSVALLDHPSYQNVGDSMIWLGQMRYLRELGIKVRYSSNIANFDADLLRRRHPDGTILLQGGGNFGDLWPDFQRFRETVLKEFPDRQIVQLPQSIYFQDPTNAERSNSALGAHPNFTLLIRDQPSAERVRAELPSVAVRMCADMALGMNPPAVGSRRREDRLLVIARNDHEAAESAGSLELAINDIGTDLPVKVSDWGLTGANAVVWRALQMPGRIVRLWPSGAPGRGAAQRIYEWAQRAMSVWLVRYGSRLVSNSYAVITNRLHAHVLARLCGVRSVALDNSYGKISAVCDFFDDTQLRANVAVDADHAMAIFSEWVTKR